jgi:hypothetical protein
MAIIVIFWMVLGIAALFLGVGGREPNAMESFAAFVIVLALLVTAQIWGALGFSLVFVFGALLRRRYGALT